MTTIDFNAWAATYDDTRGASPSVLGPLLDALGPAGGRSLLDCGGGTGNFATSFDELGFAVTLSDVAPAMVRRARTKVDRTLVADAQRLPFRDGVFDCVVSVNVLRHIPSPPLFLAEARRVLRGGPLVIKVSTAETQRSEWLHEYFPSLRPLQPRYEPESEIVAQLSAAGFRRVDVTRIHYADAADGSFQALKRFPELLLEDANVVNTAVFKRLPGHELIAGLDAVRADVASGRVREVISRYDEAWREFGDGSVFVAAP